MHDTQRDDQHDDEHDVSTVTIAQGTLAPLSDEMSAFTCREWVAFLQLRRRYREGHDLWSAHELAHLRFLRWLYATGHIEG